MRRSSTPAPGPAAVKPSRTGPHLRPLPAGEVDRIFRSVGESLREGRSGDAEHLLLRAIEGHEHTADNLANLRRLLSFTLEMAGRLKESLAAIELYADEKELAKLGLEARVRMATQLAIAYNHGGDQPKAVTLLKATKELAVENNLTRLYGNIELALARVYRKLAEYPLARGYAEASLEHFRVDGDWLAMAEAFREIANTYHQEGNPEKSIENFEHGIRIIGERSAPFILGKLYTDMSGAYWFLRRPQDGIACLEKSIQFFDQTAHATNSLIAYNNLGINLVLVGEWDKAEVMIERAHALAKRENASHLAGIYESLGDLNMLRGDLDAAERWLDMAVELATERKHQWYLVQTMCSLARCYLAKGRIDEAVATATDTIERASDFADNSYASMARLVLAESYLEMGNIGEAESVLDQLEASDPSKDFFVFGTIQRLRGRAALMTNDAELAVHHFNRGLTIFETAQDLYNTGRMHHLLGKHLDEDHVAAAHRHLAAAARIFAKLGLDSVLSDVNRQLERIEASLSRKAPKPKQAERRPTSVVSQLLTLRLAEATASRELLFRELVAVLQQESPAKKIIIAQHGENKRLIPFITHGYSPQESNEIIGKLSEAKTPEDEKRFARTRDMAVFNLRGTPASPSAVLLLSPKSGAMLNDESPLTPLLRVVELGMDLIGLREKDKSAPAERESSSYASSSIMPGFIHSSPAMTTLVDEVHKIRSSDVTVLVTGESGTGKELVSRAIHATSNRKDKIFVPFNCTAVPKELADANLFGYRKGAFTGAVSDSPGTIRTANGGTLFLDEIGDLPLDVQPKLLRFLQEGEIQPLGEKQPIKVDVRIIAATNMPLEEKVADGTFREDLYYRLNVIRLRVPPLRERRSEIPPIVNYYINHYSQRFNKHNLSITPQAVDMLMVSDWEGNVRQLCNEIQRVVARAEDGDRITPEHLSPELRRSAKPLMPLNTDSNVRPIASYDGSFNPFMNIPSGGTLESAVSELEMQLIKGSLARHNWNISRVASELGLTRRGLYLKLARYGIEKAA
jgi:DNA-binding NtrC family response regulator/tetratricopeptide (TPR) repeat protein